MAPIPCRRALFDIPEGVAYFAWRGRRAGRLTSRWVRFPGGAPGGIEERLAAAGVHVSLRGERMRITPHLHDDEADAERLFSALWPD